MYKWIIYLLLLSTNVNAQTKYYLTADRVFDGEQLRTGWAVIVDGNKIVAAGPGLTAPAGAMKINYPGATIMPGLIEGHSHLFLYPYNITDWNTQVLKETDAYRTIRATVHAKQTLMAGFTTTRDLGTEGAGYADVALKRAIDEGMVPGPRMLVSGRAIVTTGSYGPSGYDNDQQLMLGAETADGYTILKVVRDQIGKGADFIKIYADYHWGPGKEDRPTFTLEELKMANEAATSSGRYFVSHASSKEAIRRAVLAGAETIEHGDHMDLETGKLMKEHRVTYFPTLAASEKVTHYRGWKKGVDPEPKNIAEKKQSFKAAMESGVTIGMGGDVGVYPHGENVIEMELMVEYGMKPVDVLKAATSINAKALHMDQQVGMLKPGMLADIIVVSGDPSIQISVIRQVKFVMKDGVVYRQEK